MGPCGEVFAKHTWVVEVFNESRVDQKVEKFHKFLRETLEKIVPEKSLKMSNFDKKWFTPELRKLHRIKQREFFNHRYSDKFKKLSNKFERLKRRNTVNHYVNLTEKLNKTNPRNFFGVMKEISTPNFQVNGDFEVEALKDKLPQEATELIAEHFAKVSQSYEPVNFSSLPYYLPSQKPPQVTEEEIFEKIRKLKNTRSTHPLDLPARLRREVDIFLTLPLKDIFNTCLLDQVFPTLWKIEYVTPIPKQPRPENISHLQKIACTSDFSKLFEAFLKEWILEDIEENVDLSQFGGRREEEVELNI